MTAFNISMGQKIVNPRVDQIRDALTRASDQKPLKHRAYLVKTWLDLDATSVIYGQSNTGKSFFALDIAFHVAAGQSWNGCRVNKSEVIYVAAEGGTGFSKRIEAIQKEKPDLFHAAKDQFHHLPLQLDLHGGEDVEALLAAMGERKVDFLIIDTLAMSFGAGNENDGKDVTQFLTNIARIRQELDCHVMLVHHSGKDQGKGARGHSSLRAAVDTEIELVNDADHRIATTKKQRDLEGGKVSAFTLDIVELAKDNDGDPITSCIVQVQDADQINWMKKRKLSGANEVAYQALIDALKREGRMIKGSEDYPFNRLIVHAEAWYHEYTLRRAEDNVKNDSIRKAFTRARNWLQDHEYTREYCDNAWLIDELTDKTLSGQV